jgi:putative oxidoreductase
VRYPKTHVVLWTLQGFLALFFGLASGAPKLFLPPEMIPMPIPLSWLFLHFIGVAEVLGAFGLILPGLTHIRPGLTPLAAACLVLLTICAAVYQLLAGQVGNALFALTMGLLAAFVAYGRWRLAPLRGSRRSALGATG